MRAVDKQAVWDARLHVALVARSFLDALDDPTALPGYVKKTEQRLRDAVAAHEKASEAWYASNQTHECEGMGCACRRKA